MKKALRKNFYMEIRHSLGRFLSIFFIVAIGCAFFSGIRASEPDMRYSGDAYFDEKNLMDIQVMSTMGLTEDDLDAIRAVDGVLDAEGSYATDVLCTIRGNQVAVHVMALQDKMNQVQLEDGRLPEKENECVIDADYLDGKNLKIGDKITLSSGTSDSWKIHSRQIHLPLLVRSAVRSILHFTEAVQQSEMVVSVPFFAFRRKHFH